VKALFS